MKHMIHFLNNLPILIDKFILGKKNRKNFWYYFRNMLVLFLFCICPITLFFVLFLIKLNVFIEYIVIIITLIEIPLYIKLVALGSKKAKSLLIINPYISMILLGFNTGSSIFMPFNKMCKCIAKGDVLLWWIICFVFLLLNNKYYDIRKVKDNVKKHS